MKKVISVVVCTYNRAALLRLCLDSLSNQTLGRDTYEVLVVDNNSSDATLKVANEYLNDGADFRIISEFEQGLSHARNRGWKEASGEFVAYIDDDAVAAPDWLVQMESFIAHNPDAEAFGGPCQVFYQNAPPSWFPPEFGSLSLGADVREVLLGEEFIEGPNMVFRKSLLKALGGFKTSLGMKGAKISYGEETRLLLDIAEQKIPVYYLPDMKVLHLVAGYKMSLRWLLSSAFANGRCSGETLKLKRTFFSHLRGLSIGLIKMLVSMFALGRGPLKRRLYYGLSGVYWELGALVEYMNTLNHYE